jgi:hypothetical protein
MKKRLPLTYLTVAFFHVADHAWAQFTDAHSYDNTPVGTNQIELSYAYAHADSSIDTSLIIAGAKLNLNQGMISYARYLGLFNRTVWVEAGAPIGGLNGSLSGTGIQGSINGVGDSSYQAAMLLKGGPALTVEQFKNYKPTTILGMSFTVTAPTGRYNANQILNLGSDRWLFKPELALSQPFGPEQKWQLDAYANAYFYTDNTSYHGREILHQQPLPGFEGHLSYSFNDNVWLSFDTRYSFRGITFVNGVDQSNGQHNFILGSEMNVLINTRASLLFEFAKALVHQNGPALTGFAVKYNYTWGRGYQ